VYVRRPWGKKEQTADQLCRTDRNCKLHTRAPTTVVQLSSNRMTEVEPTTIWMMSRSNQLQQPYNSTALLDVRASNQLRLQASLHVKALAVSIRFLHPSSVHQGPGTHPHRLHHVACVPYVLHLFTLVVEGCT